MARNLSVKWTAHLDAEPRRKDFEQTVLNAHLVLDRLNDILDEEIKSIDKQEASLSDFESPAWDYKQAFRNGQLSVYLKLKQLLPDKG